MIGGISSSLFTNIQRSLLNSNAGVTSSLQKLSSGSQINKASDNPAGLVISEFLRSQIKGLYQAAENTQNASNMVATAEGGLSEVSNLLQDVRSKILQASSTGTTDQNQISALQAQVNSALSSIGRIADTTKYAGKALLNGSQAIETSNLPPQIQKADIKGAVTPQSIQVNVTSAASQAQVGGNIAATADQTTIRVTGSKGTEFLTFNAGTAVADIQTAINSVSENTGVIAAGGQVTSQDVGSKQTAEIAVMSGSGIGVSNTKAAGTDVQATVNASNATAEGNVIRVDNSSLNAEITLANGTGAGTYEFNITGGGLTFQVGGNAGANEQVNIGMNSVNPANLGEVGGNTLATLVSGGANSLTNNPEQALAIVDRAIAQVSAQRAEIGAFQKNTLETNYNSINVAIENLFSSESSIRDTNMANETVNLMRSKILNQTGTSMLAQAQQLTNSIMGLFK